MTVNSHMLTLAADTRMAWEVDFPESPMTWLLWLGLVVVGVAWIAWLYLRDTQELQPAWKVWLLGLRLGAWAGLVAIAANPQERTQTTSFRPSRVVIAVDTSLSMQLPEKSPEDIEDSVKTDGAGRGSGDSASMASARVRAESVRELLERSPLIFDLQRNHDVSVFTFDSTQAGPHWLFRTKDPGAECSRDKIR